MLGANGGIVEQNGFSRGKFICIDKVVLKKYPHEVLYSLGLVHTFDNSILTGHLENLATDMEAPII